MKEEIGMMADVGDVPTDVPWASVTKRQRDPSKKFMGLETIKTGLGWNAWISAHHWEDLRR